jgi:hypothetical protein
MNLRARASRTATAWSSSSGDEFARTRFPDGYRVELIESQLNLRTRLADGYRVDLIEHRGA